VRFVELRGTFACVCYTLRLRLYLSSSISIASAFHLSNEIEFNSWQRKWEQIYHRSITPGSSCQKLEPNWNRNIGISYCRLLLNDTMLKDDSNRTGTSESPLCDCGLERESEMSCFKLLMLYGCQLNRNVVLLFQNNVFLHLSGTTVSHGKTINLSKMTCFSFCLMPTENFNLQ